MTSTEVQQPLTIGRPQPLFFFSMTVSSVCPCRPPPLLLGDVPKQVHNMSLSSCVSMLTRKVPPRPFPLRSRHLKPPSPTAAPLRSNCRSAVSARWTRVCSAWLSKCLLMYVGSGFFFYSQYEGLGKSVVSFNRCANSPSDFTCVRRGLI